MKTKSILLNLLGLAVALSMTGCASSGYQKGAKTAENIQDAANQIGAMPAKIDATLAALNDLVSKPQADLVPQFKAFSAQLADMVSAGQDIAAARHSMGANGKAFFAKWDEQLALIQNEDIKARSESRKEEVTQNLLAVKRSYAEAEIAFKPFLADLKDVQKYLSVDLTPGGIATMKDAASRATADAAPLKTSIANVASAFKSLGVAMSAVTPAGETKQK